MAHMMDRDRKIAEELVDGWEHDGAIVGRVDKESLVEGIAAVMGEQRERVLLAVERHQRMMQDALAAEVRSWT